MPRSQNAVKNPEKSGLEPTAPNRLADRGFRVFHGILASRHLNLSSSSHVLLCRTQANSSHFNIFDELERCLYVFGHGAGFPGVSAGEGDADCVLCLMVDVMARGHEVSIFCAIIGGVYYAMPVELPRSGIRSARPELTVADGLERAIIDRQASAAELDDLSFLWLLFKHLLSTIFHRTYARSTHSQNLKEKHSSTYFHTHAHAPDI